MLRIGSPTLLLLLTWIFPVSAAGNDLQTEEPGHYLGVSFSAETQEEISLQDLERLRSLGFRLVELEADLSDDALQRFSESGLQIMIRSGRAFYTPSKIAANDSLLQTRDRDRLVRYREGFGDRFYGYAPFDYPDHVSDRGRLYLQNHLSQLTADRYEPPVYYLRVSRASQHPPEGYHFLSARMDRTGQSPAGTFIHLNPDTSHDHISLDLLYHAFEISTEREESLLLLPYDWLAINLDRHPWLDDVFRAYAETGQIHDIQPHEPDPPGRFSTPLLIFILLVGSYLIHYRLSSTYRECLFRYFGSRRYFIDYLLTYRIRSSISGLTLFFQHAVTLALLILLLISEWLSTQGIEALYHHLPFVETAGAATGGGFLFFFAAIVLLQLLDLLWLRIFSRHYNTTQLLSLYSWPLQLSLPLLFLVVLFAQISLPTAMLISGGSMIIVWLAAYFLTAVEIIRSGIYRFWLTLTLILIPALLLLLVGATAFLYPPLNDLLLLIRIL